VAKGNATLFDGRNAYGYLEHLAVEIGPRLTGSAGEHKAARYIEKVFKSFGLKTRLQKYPSITFDNRKTDFEVLDRGKWRSVQCQPIMMTKSTPARGIEGEIYFAENGAPEYFSPAMKDKIVMVCGGIGPDNRPKFLAHKPKALVIIEGGLSEEPIRVNMGEHNRKTYGNLPMARIRHLDGLDVIKKGLKRARLTMQITEKKSHCFNVIGEKTGTDFPDEIIVVCGHYDTSMGISGASDNAGGTSLVMELARIFASEPTKRTLRFIAFSGEETGLNGSTFYANDLARKAEREKKKKTFREKLDKTELDRHVFTFNIDVHGFILGSNSATFNGSDDIGASVRLLAKEIARPCGVSKGPMSSDGTPLAAVGIPNVQFARNGGTGSYLHSSLDDIRNLSPEGLAVSGEFAELYLRRYVTQAAAFPFPRDIPDDQMKGVKDYFKGGKRPVPGEKEEEKDKGKPKKKAGKKKGKRATRK